MRDEPLRTNVGEWQCRLCGWLMPEGRQVCQGCGEPKPATAGDGGAQ